MTDMRFEFSVEQYRCSCGNPVPNVMPKPNIMTWIDWECECGARFRLYVPPKQKSPPGGGGLD